MARRPSNLKELELIAKDEWANIPVETCKKLDGFEDSPPGNLMSRFAKKRVEKKRCKLKDLRRIKHEAARNLLSSSVIFQNCNLPGVSRSNLPEVSKVFSAQRHGRGYVSRKSCFFKVVGELTIPMISLPKGIFPASYVYLRKAVVTNRGQYETVVPLEDPIVTEVTSTLQEWAVLWKQLYVVSLDLASSY
ncbi:hypothetical protein QTP86_000171 [Hemibagrus guttatus]|nr:hypothetical protein QTP86_000171 [Hemibagrus guttatus]